MNKIWKIYLSVLLCFISANANPSQIFYEPTPYLNSSDSPFVTSSFDYFYLENFQDGLLNTPGVSATPGWASINLASQTDTVEGFFGSFFSNFTQTTLTFTFDASALGGNLPTHAGIVWTDVGPDATSDGIGNQSVTFSAIDAFGDSLGSIGPFIVGDTTTFSRQAEDRFFGVFNPSGISSITIDMIDRNNWEVDHLQYGFQINTPSTDDCIATYKTDGSLNIPCVSVPDAFGGIVMYHADMKLIPLSTPFSFELIKAQQIDRISYDVNNCAAIYRDNDTLNIPCISVPDTLSGSVIYEADMALIPLTSPFTFKLLNAQQN